MKNDSLTGRELIEKIQNLGNIDLPIYMNIEGLTPLLPIKHVQINFQENAILLCEEE